MSKRWKTQFCTSCNKQTALYIGSVIKNDIESIVFRCEICKKDHVKFFKKINMTIPAPAIIKSVEPVKNMENACKVCGKNIPADRLRRCSVTCSKEHADIHNKMQKDEYHRKRKENKLLLINKMNENVK